MIRKSSAILLLLLTITMVHAQKSEVIKAYIKSYRAVAIEEMQRTGVPAAIKLAQGIHETMAGQSELVLKSNNHFGIKCKSDYTGPYVLHNDDKPNEHFMKYDNPEQSYIDHSNFLRQRLRYAFLFELDPTDYKAWAYGLKQAGYATNPQYPQLIINLIEKYNLQDYTLIAMGKKDMPDDLKEYMAVNKGSIFSKKIKYPETDFRINETRVVYVKKGTSLGDVARQYNVPLNRIYDFNDFRDLPSVLQTDQLIYLQLKRTEGQKAFHEVKAGESIYDIAQAEGIRLEYLLRYNNMTKFNAPAIGSKLYLQNEAALTNRVANN